ncbi:MAG: hypothetical protein SNJ58_05140 [Aggregatilineales bacterium]
MPQNAEYLMLGLAAVAAIMGAYVTSLVVRFANARRALVRAERMLKK